ncbi:hypothetical protein M407DRAFT_26359 [Tulasnella calospora MUT 4182]|uniref:Protein kinase domain-containing protein n=1 Tax=Tulasnella calospora MUT 4182 TaxID=1051891 RepID=A0A0C3QFV9_9AGAM|nr:hypothetical protein M407DRAFT_26359 [Tulasnella calospora MUT 4182]
MNTTPVVDIKIEGKEFSAPTVDWSTLEFEKNSLTWSGGFADVYKASHPQLGALALKRPRGACNPGSREYRHLEKEVAIWKDLIHPNLLQFIGIYEKDAAVYIVSPFLHNGTVPQYLSKNADADRASFIRDLARGLNYLHQRGIIHGDIKGSNLLVSSSVPVYGLVADFGLAKLEDTHTVTSLQGAGTPRWQSPELLYGGPRTFKSDVYAFGMTVYEIISGKIPFENVPNYAVFFKVYKKERPVPMPRVSSSGYMYIKEWEVAQGAWDHDDERRPSMDRILESLESQNNSEKYIKARIKVVCEQMPQYTGYVSRSLEDMYGSQQVTQDVSKSLIVAWDPESSGLQRVYMLNSHEGLALLALRFNEDSPNYFNDEYLWAAFTAASGTQDNYNTVWTEFAQGLDLLPFWSCSEKWELTPHALGGMEIPFLESSELNV